MSTSEVKLQEVKLQFLPRKRAVNTDTMGTIMFNTMGTIMFITRQRHHKRITLVHVTPQRWIKALITHLGIGNNQSR